MRIMRVFYEMLINSNISIAIETGAHTFIIHTKKMVLNSGALGASSHRPMHTECTGRCCSNEIDTNKKRSVLFLIHPLTSIHVID